MEYEDLVEGYEDSILAPFVAIGREMRAAVRELGIVGIAQICALEALTYATMWLACFLAAA